MNLIYTIYFSVRLDSRVPTRHRLTLLVISSIKTNLHMLYIICCVFSIFCFYERKYIVPLSHRSCIRATWVSLCNIIKKVDTFANISCRFGKTERAECRLWHESYLMLELNQFSYSVKSCPGWQKNDQKYMMNVIITKPIDWCR